METTAADRIEQLAADLDAQTEKLIQLCNDLIELEKQPTTIQQAVEA